VKRARQAGRASASSPDGDWPGARPQRRPALIIYSDGTVIEDCGYVTSTDQMVLLPGVGEALAEARQAGAVVVLATNQAAIGRGVITEDTLTALHDWLGTQVELDAIYFCPHHPDDGCDCRKPMPGLLEQAILQLDLDRARTVFVGDKVSDCFAGRAAGIDVMLVRTGHGAAEEGAAIEEGFRVVDDLPAAVRAFLARLGS
jgi:D-glycero-D-manno-heptose 1,7-bisphosphate phosphatase